ncbi:MAG: hypothetical protein KDA37_16155 [Planctomycetales bacterium]|nr:hypothetical protein [Planctomycetales bacterium]
MDQIKAALAWLKKHHFWVLLALAIGIGIGVWHTAASDIAQRTEANKKAIDQEFSSAQRIGSRAFHPNEQIINAQKHENELLAAKVNKTWQEFYDRQVNEVLKWPAVQLGPAFIERVSKLSFGDDILVPDRTSYLNYIKKTFPELPKIVGAIEAEGEVSGGRGGRGGGRGGEGDFGGFDFGGLGARGGGLGRGSSEEPANEDFIVQWHDQLALKEELTWQQTPSSLAIWVTQEDLWVYQTLLGAIARTNKAAGADRYSNAAVRDIYQLQVGKQIQRERASESRIFVPESAGAFGRRGGGDIGDGDYSGRGGGDTGAGDFDSLGGEPGEDGAGAGEAEKMELLAGRYVDADGKPITQPTDGKFKYGEEYKRLPVRLVMRLDQRWLSRLIIELANAPLQVEVEEVRINPQGESASGMGMRARSNSDTEVQVFESEPYVRDPIVIEGVVYIFYPPDESQFQVSEEGGGFAAN